MKKQINLNLKRFTFICTLVALFSAVCFPVTITHAAENDFEKVKLSLNSNVAKDTFIDMYVQDFTYYITIDELCKLTRCSKTVEDNIITVKQGIWSAEFDVAEQVFNDGYQAVDVTILEVSEDEYAVPALMFLSYYNSMSLIENDTLYCRMSECTPWEALDVNYGNSLVDIYELYGGEGNVTLSLTLDIIMDFIMGENLTSDGYLKDAYNAALNVDMYSYDAIQDYVENSTERLYNDLVSEKTTEFLGVISSKQEYDDSNVESSLEISQEVLELYIDYASQNKITKFYNLAFDALQVGDKTTMTRYADQIVATWKDGEAQKILTKNKIKTVEGTLFLLSSAIEAAQQVKYANQANNLIYRVMGQKNLNKLNMDANSNEWFKVANAYESTSVALQESFAGALAELQGKAVNDLVSEAAKQIGIDSIAGVKTGVWKMGLESGRIAVKLFSWIDSLVSDTWLDHTWTDAGAFKADRLALYLSELQQNVYWVTCNELNRLSNNLSDLDAYSDYIYAQQLYCRTSIAMYENLIAMIDELGQNRDYWTNLFQTRIDMLVVSLYQLTMLQDDGVNACLPLDLGIFSDAEIPSKDTKYQAYAKLIERYELQYGIAEVCEMDEWFSYMTGLCFMKLVDFEQNGQEDLLLVYQTNVDDAWGSYREYTFEVWGGQGSEIFLLDSGELFSTDGGVKSVYLAEYNENIYLVTGGADSFGYYYYHGYSDGEFGIVREAEWDWNEVYICSIDGVDMTYEEFELEQEKWLRNSVEYNLNYDCDTVLLINEETKRALSIY